MRSRAVSPSVVKGAPALNDEPVFNSMNCVVEAMRAATSADAVLLILGEPDPAGVESMRPSVSIGLDERLPQGQGLEAALELAHRAVALDAVIDFPEALCCGDLDLPLLTGGERPGAACIVPLRASGHVLGVAQLYHLSARAAPLEMAGFAAIADLAGAYIFAARGHARESGLHARLAALDAGTRALAGERSIEHVLQRIVKIAVAAAGARYGALGVVGADGTLADFVTTGLSHAEREQIGAPPRGHGLLGVLIRHGEPLRVPAIDQDMRRAGFPPHHPVMTSLLGVPIRAHESVVGDLYLTDKIGYSEFSGDDQYIVELLAAHAGVAIENARLNAQAGALTQERERTRIARDLHDGIIQDIYAANLQLEACAEDVTDSVAQDRLFAIADQLTRVIVDIRTYIQGLRARELAGRLLDEGIAALVEDFDGRGGMRATFALEGQPYRLPDAPANTLLLIARETLSNVTRHAEATELEVGLCYDKAGVTLTVSDNGRGFDVEGAHGDEHRGLINMRGRAQDAGGTFSLRSVAGAGTTVRVWLPSMRSAQ